MGYDEELADRIRHVVEGEPGLTEKRMFGGVAFLIDGHLAASASSQGGMLLRVDPADTAALTERPFVSRFRMRGREMDGWLHVETTAVKSEESLRSWLAHGLTYARSLPPK